MRTVGPAYAGKLLYSFLSDDLGCVDISVMGLTAVRAAPASLFQIQLTPQMLSCACTQVTAGEVRMDHDETAVPALCTLVRELAGELVPACTHEVLGEFAVLGHACDVESLDAYDLVFVDEASGQLVQVVLALAVLVAFFEGLRCGCVGLHFPPSKRFMILLTKYA